MAIFVSYALYIPSLIVGQDYKIKCRQRRRGHHKRSLSARYGGGLDLTATHFGTKHQWRPIFGRLMVMPSGSISTSPRGCRVHQPLTQLLSPSIQPKKANPPLSLSLNSLDFKILFICWKWTNIFFNFYTLKSIEIFKNCI